MFVLIEVCNEVDNCNVSLIKSEQYVVVRKSCVTRNESDLNKISEFFEILPESMYIMSIFSGVNGGNFVNYHKAYKVGRKSAESIVGKNFGRIHFNVKMS